MTFAEQLQGRRRQTWKRSRIPLRSPDFAPSSARSTMRPRRYCLCLFLPGPGRHFRQAICQRGAGTRPHQADWPGDLTDDATLPGMGDAMLGVVTAAFLFGDAIPRR